ncbi:MAG TPA: hypothetical protein VMS00_01240 [Acidimicrobiales bacterium]|nr:hypothetical protein [Acidimicrobiales bacterium]
MTATIFQATPKYNPSPAALARTTPRVRQAAAWAVLFVLAAAAALLLVWGMTHNSQSSAGPRRAETPQVTTLSSQQLLSQLRAENGSRTSLTPSAACALTPPSTTVVALPPNAQTSCHH